MRLDSDIRRDIDAELKWNPEVEAVDIASKVTGGVVTLYGSVENLREKHLAEVTVKRLAGVKAVANELTVRPTVAGQFTDSQLARAAVDALRQELPGSWEKIRPMVRNGRVVLEGMVNWHYMRIHAEDAVRKVPGIRELRNSIQVQAAILDGDVNSAIEAALRRNGVVDSRRVAVEVRGSEVILQGNVQSWTEREAALQAVWSAPGVTNVIDELVVGSE